MPQGLTLGSQVPDPRQDWLQPQNDSVFDSDLEKAVKWFVRLVGLDDPNNQVLGLMAPLEVPAKAAMDTASRMARAKAQGFTEDMYHGTGATDIKAMRPDRANWVTRDPEVASHYAEVSGRYIGRPTVYPMKVKPGNSISHDELLAIEAEVQKRTGKHVFLGGKDTALVDELRTRGVDSVRFDDNALAVVNPSNIRSRFAAFDPAKSNSSDLLATLVAAMAGIGSAAQEPPK